MAEQQVETKKSISNNTVRNTVRILIDSSKPIETSSGIGILFMERTIRYQLQK